jgi:hypothetical protein
MKKRPTVNGNDQGVTTAHAERPHVETADVGGAEVPDRRGRCLLELTEEILRKRDPLAANLGLVNCNLLQLARTLYERLSEAFARQPDTPEELQQLARAFDQYMKVTKQIERYVQVDIKMQQMSVAAEGLQPDPMLWMRRPIEEMPI